MRFLKFASIAVAAALFALPAHAVSILSGNFGLANQTNFLSFQGAQTNTAGFIIIGTDITTQAAGNAAVVDMDNANSALVLNAGQVNQLNLATVQASQTNTAGVFILGTDIATLSVGNSVSADLTNTNTFLGLNAFNSNQVNAVTAQVAQTNTIGVVIAGSTITTGAIGNSVSMSMTNQ